MKKIRTNAQLKQKYIKLNKKFFGGKLPDIEVKFSSKRDPLPSSMLGGALWERGYRRPSRYYKILVLRGYGTVISTQTLLHEMIHVKIGHKYDHGPKFEKEIVRLFKAGAYRGLL